MARPSSPVLLCAITLVRLSSNRVNSAPARTVSGLSSSTFLIIISVSDFSLTAFKAPGGKSGTVLLIPRLFGSAGRTVLSVSDFH